MAAVNPAIDWHVLARERAKSGHALLGPSTWPRLFRCPGSLELSVRANAPNRDSEYAREGTCAHYLADCVLSAGLDDSPEADEWNQARDYIGCTMYAPRGEGSIEFEVTQEMAHYVQLYVDWCRDLPGEHFTECRVDISKYVPLPQQFGTSDHAAIYEHELFDTVLCVTDLKYGEGEQVFAARNEQAMAYALGFYDEWSWCYDIKWVVIRICQPRLDHYDVWECSVEDLIEFGKTARKQMEFVLSGEATCTAGEKQCRFCPVSGQCATEKAAVDALTAGDFDAFEETKHAKPELMTIDDLDRVVAEKKLIKGWLAKVEGVLIQRILNGSKAPSQRVVEGRAIRQWKNADDAEIWLLRQKLTKTQITKTSLISVADAEKFLTKEQKAEMEAKELWRKPSGKPVLAPLSDKRPDFHPLANEFDEFDEEEDDVLGD